ncbi:MAG TPA: DUF1203 domain-containing protein [Steroidobacteraceae bacterium]|nr:DUF1203 domain-containing protein [Steroidobacteraceae bacterium]
MSFRIQGLSRQTFQSLIGQPDEMLLKHGARRLTTDSAPGYPDRITLDDVPVGESVLLVHHEHQSADTPFRASHAIFVWEHAPAIWDRRDEIPPAIGRRLISLRAFDSDHMMIDADIAPGDALPNLIERFFANARVAYLHAHYAKWGCYAARVDRT